MFLIPALTNYQEVGDFKKHEDFPGGTVDGNLPGSPGDRRFNPLSRKILHATEQLSPCTAAAEPASPRALRLRLLSPCASPPEAHTPGACGLPQSKPCNEQPVHHSQRADPRHSERPAHAAAKTQHSLK